ncbi:serine/threonine-protein kinase PINK1, mitochondrial-like [Stegodyphus dumicola]|uniref:serine/threonine-protein kinase PINK1, mitochondrial-like n=1 Tax=Stegodyphus dumicola TaxID=202533 RepID=UPI0015B1E494|nr:serine/threonine-protein kinase PINK1, mitochondrial-like [Stegodyphus dumicola]
MYKERLPAIDEFSLGELTKHKVRKRKLGPHPNIFEMYFAFADQTPLFPGAFTNYSQDLPVRLLSDGCGKHITLFLVMERCSCNLKEYLKRIGVSGHTALLLFTQLLEALVNLLQNDITHRDLKTYNILLDFQYAPSSPRLAITVFGCCHEDLYMVYNSYDSEKAGNIAFMAPEIVNVEACPISVIDYSRSDLRRAGTLAYEVYGGTNPFCSEDTVLARSIAIMEYLTKTLQKMREIPMAYWIEGSKAAAEKIEVEPILTNKRILKRKKQFDELYENESQLLHPAQLFLMQ